MKAHNKNSRDTQLSQSETGYLSLNQRPALIDASSECSETELAEYKLNNNDEEEKSVAFHLHYKKTPDGFPFDVYEAYKIRLVSFANGAIYAIKNNNDPLEDQAKKITAIKNLLKTKIQELENFKREMNGDSNVDFGSELYQFYNKDLPKESGLKPKQIALGEAMYVWQEVPRPTRYTTYRKELNIDNGCDALSTLEQPTLANMDNLPFTSNAAYIRCGAQIYYINKAAKICMEVNLDWYGDQAKAFQDFMDTIKPNNKAQRLTESQLTEIESITNHYHVKDLNQGYLRIEQSDIPRVSKLTNDQKDELARIFASNEKIHPDWYKALPPFSQNALKKLLKPDGKTWNWNNYEKCHPTILRHILGEANATTHRLVITHVKKNGKEVVLSDTTSIRQGAPTSFNMKDANERQKSAKENIKQMLSDTAIQSAREKFKNAWGLEDEKDNTKFPLPVVLVGLLTPAHQAGYLSALLDRVGITGGENNTLLTSEKNAAFDAWHNPADKTIRAFNLNVGVNWQRHGVIAPDKEFIFFVNKFYSDIWAYLKLNEKSYAPDKWSELMRKHAQLGYVVSALNALDGKPSTEKGRNENLYTAALYDVAARLMYGLDTGNCKSSKDRKGVEFIMADAMLAYLAEKEALGEKPRFPSINDKNPDRARFVEIFCELYASGHQLLLAHDNSPGCPGIKDEGILDEDIKVKLNEMRMTYARSKKTADLNKPGTFWKKYRGKIILGSMIAGAVILGIASIVGMATGFLSPFAIIGGALATQLGAAAFATGLSVNIAIPMLGGASLARLGCAVGDSKDANKHKKGLFENQIKRARSKNSTTNKTELPVTPKEADITKKVTKYRKLKRVKDAIKKEKTKEQNSQLSRETKVQTVEERKSPQETKSNPKSTDTKTTPRLSTQSDIPSDDYLLPIIRNICTKYLISNGNLDSRWQFSENLQISDYEDPLKIKKILLQTIKNELELESEAHTLWKPKYDTKIMKHVEVKLNEILAAKYPGKFDSPTINLTSGNPSGHL